MGLTGRWRENLARCLRCGLCREGCPAFRARGDERFSPRGRLALVEVALEGEDFGASLAETLDYCLACGACAERCPSGVAGDVLVLAARAAGLCRGGFPLFKSWAYRLALRSPSVLGALTAFLSAAQRLRLLTLTLAVLGLPRRVALPRVPFVPFDARTPPVVPARGGWKGRVTYFPGCGTNYLYPAAARAVTDLLTRAGYDVAIPRGRRCCGIPALANGDVKLARRLAEDNVRALAGDEAVVVDCGSCGEVLAFYYNDVLEIPGAAPLKERVKDFTDLLTPEDVPARAASAVAYHDACHLRRGMGVGEGPRNLLRVAGEVRELAPVGAVVCCGGAGAYGLTHADVFFPIGDERAQAVAACGAGVVAAGCPACVFYLNEAFRRAGLKAEARHTAEVLVGRNGAS